MTEELHPIILNDDVVEYGICASKWGLWNVSVKLALGVKKR